jgi:cyclohexanecarboxylate-CoA ligase
MVSCGDPADTPEGLEGFDGRAIPGAEIRVVDEQGWPQPPGTEGEVEVFGPQLCVGYVDAALNDAFQPDGFFRTGDLGVMDAEGRLRITGRRKDIIIRKGENISAKGIEDELSAHPDVVEVAVVGVPDPASGERVCACIVARDGATPTLDDVRRFMLARGVMVQKVPEQLVLLPALPRNAIGKVRKDVLRAQLRGA